ncbi:hypothetical protein HaLaN_25371, partial [Haematococcus lacustris]
MCDGGGLGWHIWHPDFMIGARLGRWLPKLPSVQQHGSRVQRASRLSTSGASDCYFETRRPDMAVAAMLQWNKQDVVGCRSHPPVAPTAYPCTRTRQSQGVRCSAQPKEHGDNSDSDEDDDPVVQLSEDELHKMLFGDKDFTLPSDADGNTAGAPAQPTASEAVKNKAAKAQRWQATCSAALTTLGYSEKLVELTIQALMEQGSQMEPSDVVASLQPVGTVVTGVPNLVPSVAGGVGSTQRASPASPVPTSHKEEQLMVALANCQAALPRPETQPQALGAALLLEQQFIRDRLVRVRQTFQLEEAILSEEWCSDHNATP